VIYYAKFSKCPSSGCTDTLSGAQEGWQAEFAWVVYTDVQNRGCHIVGW